MESMGILAMLAVGFIHAFEADHLAAMSVMSSYRKSALTAMKDGVLWGMGHTLTIFVAGMVLLSLKWTVDEEVFSRFEVLVGIMLVLMGLWRIMPLVDRRFDRWGKVFSHSHHMAFGVGIIHGLAGSGSVIILALSKVRDQWMGLALIGVFGLGTILGMLLAAGILHIPFGRRFVRYPKTRVIMSWLSGIICTLVGLMFIYENIPW